METDLIANNEVTAIHRKMMKATNFTFQDIVVINKLIEFQARTKTICSILRNSSIQITESDVGRLFKHANGKASSRGLEAYSPDRMLGTSERVYHASFYVTNYKKLFDIYQDAPIAHIECYQQYLDVFEQEIDDPVLSFSLAYRICQYTTTGEFVLVRCHDCKLKFIHQTNTPISQNSCPCCSLLRRREKPALHLVSSQQQKVCA